MPAYEQQEYAERQGGDFHARRVATDADGDDDGDDDEAEEEVPVEVVEGPGAGAAERAAGGGFLGETDGAGDEGVDA